MMRAVLLHDDLPDGARADELDVFAQAAEVEPVLHAMGYATSRLPFTLDLRAVRAELEARRPDVAFNFVEAVDGKGRLLHLSAALLDAMGIPYTGASAEALLLTTHKLLAKRVLRLAGLPTPDWRDARGRSSGGEPPSGCFVVKPVAEDASVGFDEDAVVHVDGSEAIDRLLAERAEQIGREVFAERYVEGREFNLSVLAGPDGPEVLPVAEIQFVDYAPERPRVVGYRAKWDAKSFEFHHTPRTFEFPAADAPLLDELRRLSLACWELFDLRGYVRVDFRVDAAGRPWILEVNANPCLSPDAGFAAAARQGGLSGADVVRRILADAFQASACRRK